MCRTHGVTVRAVGGFGSRRLDLPVRLHPRPFPKEEGRQLLVPPVSDAVSADQGGPSPPVWIREDEREREWEGERRRVSEGAGLSSPECKQIIRLVAMRRRWLKRRQSLSLFLSRCLFISLTLSPSVGFFFPPPPLREC